MGHSLDREPLWDAGHAGSSVVQGASAAGDEGSCAPVSLAFPASAQPSRPAGGWVRSYWVWTVCGCLLLAVGLVFGQTVRHGFIGYDDEAYVYENPYVRAGLTLPGFWWALTDGPFGEWYPLTMLSHMLDCDLYGLEPAGHYLTNVLLHAASSVLLFLILLRMTGNLWPSAWVAAVFAIHPLHVESVAWLAERRDMLSGLFFMLTLGAYARYAERPSPARYLAVVGLSRLGADVQANTRDGSFPSLATRLLATRPVWIGGRRNSTRRVRRVVLSAAREPEAGGGKNPVHGVGGGELRNRFVDPSDDAGGRVCRTDIAWDGIGQRTRFVCGIFGPVCLPCRSVSPLPASGQPPADHFGCRSTHFAVGDHGVCRRRLAALAFSAGWLAVVFGNAGSGNWVGGKRFARPSRPLHLSEPDWRGNRAGLGNEGSRSLAPDFARRAVGTMDDWHGVGSGHTAACRGRVASNFVLEQCGDALEPCARLQRAKQAGSLFSCCLLYQTRKHRESNQSRPGRCGRRHDRYATGCQVALPAWRLFN